MTERKSPLIRDPDPLWQRIMRHTTDDPAENATFVALAGVLALVEQESTMAQGMAEMIDDDQDRNRVSRALNYGVQLGIIQMCNRIVRSIAENIAPLPPPGTPGETEAKLRAKIAEEIRAELVDCDVYDRLAPLRERIDTACDDWSERQADLDREAGAHALCYWGEAAARIAEGRLDGVDESGVIG